MAGSTMAMQQGMANIMSKVGMALEEASQTKKRHATVSPGGSSSGQGASTLGKIPPLPGDAAPALSKPQSSMVSDMVQAALKSAVTGMGVVIEEHLLAANERLDAHDKKHKEADDKMNYTNAQLVKQEEQIGKLINDVGMLRQEAETSAARAMLAEQALAAISAAGPPPGLASATSEAAASSSHGGAQVPQDTPYEQRTHAVLGGLGWDETAERLMQVANSTLTKAGVNTATYSAVTAIVSRNNEGSTAQLVFRTPGELAAAKLLVRAAQCKGWSDKNIWLDAKKSRTEMKPARLVHRIAQVLTDFEDARADKQPVEKNMIGKNVRNASGQLGWSRAGIWIWTAVAKARYTVEQLDIAKSYAEE